MTFLRLLSAVLISILGSSLSASAATGGGKVALVIGNGAYDNAPDLPNPPNDARAIGKLLRSLGFTVIEGVDVDKQEMVALVDQFTEKAYGADLGLVFYAGHGMQVGGKNYLIPVDAKLTSPAHLRTRTIEIGDVIASLPADPHIGVVFLDACRDNPLARSLARSLPATRSSSIGTGLAPVQVSSQGDGTGGTLIAYATDPGAVALDGQDTQNSPYTTALLKHLATPGIELQSALTRVRGEVAKDTEGRQRPWHNASLGREVFLGGPVKPSIIVSSDETTVAQPNTVVAALPAASTADSAVRTTDKNAAWAVESRFWDEATKRNTIAHYEAYLSEYPQGKFAQIASLNIDQLRESEAQEDVAPIVAPATSVHSVNASTRASVALTDEIRATPGTAVSEAAIGLTRDDLRDLQQRLNALGHDAGSPDGLLGPNSRRALGSWQKANGIVETQMLTPSQWAVLQVQSESALAELLQREAAAAAAAKARRKSAAKTRTTKNPPKRVTTRSSKSRDYRKPTRQREAYRDPTPRRGGYRDPPTRREDYNRRRRGSRTGAYVGGAVLGAGAAILTCKAIGAC